MADIHKRAEKIVLENYAPPCVLINDRFEILHFIGHTDRYLSMPSGKASFNILKMAREGLRYKLNIALHQALKQKKTITNKGLEIKHNDKLQTVDLVVQPMTESTLSQAFMKSFTNFSLPINIITSDYRNLFFSYEFLCC